MFYKSTITIIVFILIAFSQALTQIPAQNSNTLTQPNKDNIDNCQTTLEFFRNSIWRNAGGFVWAKSSCPEKNIFPDLKPGQFTLDERLGLVTRMNPNYTWTNEDGVINLVPSKSMPELLKVKIHSLKVTFDTNLMVITDQILKSPEIVEKQKELNLRGGMDFGGLSSPPSKRPPVEMIFEDRTLLEILNAIVRKHGWGVWLYREYTYRETDYFTLTFVAR